VKQILIILICLLFITQLFCVQNSQEIKKKIHLSSQEVKLSLLIELASCYPELSFDECIQYGNEALELARQKNDEQAEAEIFLILARLYDQAKNYKSSTYFYSKSITLKDSLFYLEFEHEQKQIRKQIFLRNSFMIAFLVLLNIAFFFYFRYRSQAKARNKLESTHEQLKEIARTDPLTGLSNRRDIIEKIEYEQIRFERSKNPFVIIIGDLDFFKSINDRYGHDCGDYVLKEVAQIMRSTIRKQDIVSRWGGEEFLLLLPETPIEGGKVAAEKVRKKIEKSNLKYNNDLLSVTITFGVSVYNSVMDIDDCIKKADQALYNGKHKGRNCVVALKPEDIIIG
jgi:diguanylate cyclase (GGDEF)-like protein